MDYIRFYVFLSVACSSVVIGQGDVTTNEPVTINLRGAPDSPASVGISKSSSDTPVSVGVLGVSSESRIPSESPLSSIQPILASSETPIPSSSAPDTTLVLNLESKKTTTTTPAPTTKPPTTIPPTTDTPAPEPKPTPAPGPLPVPTQGTWYYADKSTNVTCILVQFAAQLNVTYTKNINNTSSLAYVIANVPANASVVDGSCNTTSQWMKLSWPESGDYSILLLFTANETTKNYALKSLNISLNPDILPNSSLSNPVELWHGVEWQVPLATSYRCVPTTQLNLTTEITSVAATLSLSQLQEEAFRTAKNSKTFSAGRDCSGSDLPDAVPIAVGCALGGLVVVVLIAYLEGRRRSAARGYLSM